MDIEEAFTQQAITVAGVDVEGEEEVAVRQMIRRVCEAQEPPVAELQRDQENVALLCFVAGRAYEQQFRNGSGVEDLQLLIKFARFLIAEEEK